MPCNSLRRSYVYLSYSLLRRLFYLTIWILWLNAIDAPQQTACAQSRARRNIAGQRAVVIDERVAALRERPDVKAPIRQRLRRGRILGVLKTGSQYQFVQITRRTRGWILSEAIVRSGNAEDAARLLELAQATEDLFTRARLARICADEFRNAPAASRALLLLAQAAEAAGPRLTREAHRQNGSPGRKPDEARQWRELRLSHPSLDRWNRIGITFDYDAEADSIVYDGAAYQELLRKYPRSEEAQTVQARLAQEKAEKNRAAQATEKEKPDRKP